MPSRSSARLRARHDGFARSPWNEIECGNHYARSLASWGLLLAFSGVQYDGPNRTLGFDPATSEYSGFFSTGTGWGHVTIDGTSVELELLWGELALDRVLLRGRELTPAEVTLFEGDIVRLT